MKQQKFVRLFMLAAIFAASLGCAEVLRAQGALPKIAFRDRHLPNGMRVLSAVDHSSPTVAIQVWYHVGSKDDPAGRSGFAHLFEHLMFKDTKRMPAGFLDRLTADVGGGN